MNAPTVVWCVHVRQPALPRRFPTSLAVSPPPSPFPASTSKAHAGPSSLTAHRVRNKLTLHRHRDAAWLVGTRAKQAPSPRTPPEYQDTRDRGTCSLQEGPRRVNDITAQKLM